MNKLNKDKIRRVNLDDIKRTREMINIYNTYKAIMATKVNGEFIFDEPVIFSKEDIEEVRRIRLNSK